MKSIFLLILIIFFLIPARRLIWNFKNKKCQETFKRDTCKTSVFTDCYKDSLEIEKQIKNWKMRWYLDVTKHLRKLELQKSNSPKKYTIN